MKNRVILFAAMAALGCSSLVGAGETDPIENAIQAREAAFTLFAANLGPMGAMAKNEIPFDKEKFARRVANLEALSTMPWEFFIPDSQKGSKAGPAVWKKADDFKAKAEIFQEKVAELARVSRSGDEEAMRDKFRSVASSCKACHKHYKED